MGLCLASPARGPVRTSGTGPIIIGIVTVPYRDSYRPVPPAQPGKRDERRWNALIRQIITIPVHNARLGMSKLKLATIAAIVAAVLIFHRRRRGPPGHTDEA